MARHNNTHNIDPNYLIFGLIVPYITLNYVKQQLVSKDHALVTLARVQQVPHANTLHCVSNEMGTQFNFIPAHHNLQPEQTPVSKMSLNVTLPCGWRSKR